MWFHSIIPSSVAPRVAEKTKRRRRRAKPAASLQLESLENRCLLTFMAPVDYGVGQDPRAVVAADLTHNGIQDLVTCNFNYNNSSVSVMLGNGDGTFQPGRPFATGPNPMSVAVGDLTGNGKLDIVTANSSYVPNNASVSVLMGNGDGAFQAPLTFTLPNIRDDNVSVAVADMNHDGHPDVVVTGDSTASPTFGVVDVFLGHGDGTFSLAATTNLSGIGINSVKLADVNGDGNLDVAATVASNSSVAVLTGNGNGTLGAPTYFATGADPLSLAVGDVNGDGKLDLVTANYAGNSYSSGSVSVLLGNGDGSFKAATNAPLPSVSSGGFAITAQRPQAIVMGDLNRDGKMDLAVAGSYMYSANSPPFGSYYYYGATVTPPVVNVLVGNGDGTFAFSQSVRLNASAPYALTAGDFNGDAYPDLAVTEPAYNFASVLINGANGPVSTQPSSFSVSGYASSIQAGTTGSFTVTALNAGGAIDTSYTGTINFSSSDSQAALPAAYTFTAADAGKHTFSATLKTAGTQSITATDAASGTLTGSETGITVTPAAASHFGVSAPTSSIAGSAFSVTVTAIDPYGNTATGYAGAVHFASSDGQAVLPGNYAFTAADAGVHTFASGVSLKTAGNQTVTATDTSTASITGSAGVSVSPAAASTIIVTGFPSPITAGASGTFTVTLQDAYGNIATGYTGTVHFTSSDAKAVLPPNYTFTGGDAGKHSFSATLKTAGTQSITTTDTVNASLHGADSGITVKAAAASKFVLSAPSSVMPGQAFSLTVTVEDAYGNIVTGYTGTIHFSSSDTKAILPANYTFTASDSGVHTFTGLVLKQTGNQTISVTDTKNSNITGKTVVDVV